jgi:hypothetical protein
MLQSVNTSPRVCLLLECVVFDGEFYLFQITVKVKMYGWNKQMLDRGCSSL